MMNFADELVQKIFPNFSESHIYDGDLVDMKIQNMHSAWTDTVTAGSLISPQRMVRPTSHTSQHTLTSPRATVALHVQRV